MTSHGVARRALLGAVLLLAAGGCGRKSPALSPRADRMVRWLQTSGRDNVMAPETFALMGISNNGLDIPVRQLAEDGPDGRYVVSLVNIRQIHELVFHRRQGDVLIFHHSDVRFARLVSIRYPRNGRPTIIDDTAVADADFQQQLAFWFDRMPGR